MSFTNSANSHVDLHCEADKHPATGTKRKDHTRARLDKNLNVDVDVANANATTDVNGTNAARAPQVQRVRSKTAERIYAHAEEVIASGEKGVCHPAAYELSRQKALLDRAVKDLRELALKNAKALKAVQELRSKCDKADSEKTHALIDCAEWKEVANRLQAQVEDLKKEVAAERDAAERCAAECALAEEGCTNAVQPAVEVKTRAVCVKSRTRGVANPDHEKRSPKKTAVVATTFAYEKDPFFSSLRITDRRRLAHVFFAFKKPPSCGPDLWSLAIKNQKTDANHQSKMVDELLRLKGTEWSEANDAKALFANLTDHAQFTATHKAASDRKFYLCKLLWPDNEFTRVGAEANTGAWRSSGKYVGAAKILKNIYVDWQTRGCQNTTLEDAQNQCNAYDEPNKITGKKQAAAAEAVAEEEVEEEEAVAAAAAVAAEAAAVAAEAVAMEAAVEAAVEAEMEAAEEEEAAAKRSAEAAEAEAEEEEEKSAEGEEEKE